MAKRLSDEQLKKARREFQEKAAEGFDRMFGSDGQNGLVTFAQREERACDIGDELTRWLMEEHLAADETADPGEEVACPLCAAQVSCLHPQRQEMQPRELTTRRGKIAFERAARRCPRCRRIFFPAG